MRLPEPHGPFSLGARCAPPDGDATIGGHLIELLVRVPEAGEVVELEGREVMILAVDEARSEALRSPLLSDTLEE